MKVSGTNGSAMTRMADRSLLVSMVLALVLAVATGSISCASNDPDGGECGFQGGPSTSDNIRPSGVAGEDSEGRPTAAIAFEREGACEPSAYYLVSFADGGFQLVASDLDTLQKLDTSALTSESKAGDFDFESGAHIRIEPLSPGLSTALFFSEGAESLEVHCDLVTETVDCHLP